MDCSSENGARFRFQERVCIIWKFIANFYRLYRRCLPLPEWLTSFPVGFGTGVLPRPSPRVVSTRSVGSRRAYIGFRETLAYNRTTLAQLRGSEADFTVFRIPPAIVKQLEHSGRRRFASRLHKPESSVKTERPMSTETPATRVIVIRGATRIAYDCYARRTECTHGALRTTQRARNSRDGNARNRLPWRVDGRQLPGQPSPTPIDYHYSIIVILDTIIIITVGSATAVITPSPRILSTLLSLSMTTDVWSMCLWSDLKRRYRREWSSARAADRVRIRSQLLSPPNHQWGPVVFAANSKR